MATLNENNVFFSLNGVDCSGEWTGQLSRSFTANQQPIPAGAGLDWELFARGLYNYELTLRLRYDTTNYQATVQPAIQAAIESGAVMIYGPEGQVSGKPRDELKVNVSGTSMTQSIEKEMVVWELKMGMSDTVPVAIIDLGGAFS